MEVLHSLCAAIAAVSVVALVAWGATSCSQQDKELREACIKNGASVINNGAGFHCIRTAGASVEH